MQLIIDSSISLAFRFAGNHILFFFSLFLAKACFIVLPLTSSKRRLIMVDEGFQHGELPSVQYLASYMVLVALCGFGYSLKLYLTSEEARKQVLLSLLLYLATLAQPAQPSNPSVTS